MYLPASELQQYKGQWTCPNCLMDARTEENRSKYEYKPKKPVVQLEAHPERCERCGRDVDIIYIWNGKRLCRSCVEDGQKQWATVGGGPSGAPQRISVVPLKAAKKKSLIESFFSELLALLGLKRKEKEVYLVVQPIKNKAKRKIDKDALKEGQVEGLMTTKSRRDKFSNLLEEPAKTKKKSSKKPKKKKQKKKKK